MNCAHAIEKRIDEFIKIFENTESFALKMTEFTRRHHYSLVTNFTDIAKQFKLNYFDSLSPHSLSFRMIAQDLSMVFDELNEK